MTIIAYIIAVLSLLEIFTQPFKIGKDRGVLTPMGYVVNMTLFALVVLLCWHVITT